MAGGRAFTFGYAETAELLAAAGRRRSSSFDPLRDEALPPGTAGLVLGGGFPEVHADELSANEPLRADVAALAARGAPVAAECAGLLYLCRELDGLPMCGVLDAEAAMTPRLTLGYRAARTARRRLLAAAGAGCPAHEFHRTTVRPGPATTPAWRWTATGPRAASPGPRARLATCTCTGPARRRPPAGSPPPRASSSRAAAGDSAAVGA